jgi:hypothetical protein
MSPKKQPVPFARNWLIECIFFPDGICLMIASLGKGSGNFPQAARRS